MFSQEHNKIELANQLITKNKTGSLDIIINELSKDTITNNVKYKADLFLLFGKYYHKKNKDEVALKHLNRAEKLFKQVSDFEKIANTYYNKFLLFNTREGLNTQKEALYYLKLFYDYAKENSDKKKLRDAYLGFGSLYFNPKEYKKSLEYYNSAMIVCKELKDTFSIAKINCNKGLITSYFIKNQDSARAFYRKSNESFSKLRKYDRMFSLTVNIGTSYGNENRYNEALESYHHADSIPIVKYRDDLKKKLYFLIAKNYEKIKEYKKANKYIKLALAYKDSINTKEQNIAIAEIQTKYKNAKIEKFVIQLKADKEKQKTLILFGGVFFIGIITISTLYFNYLKRKRDLAEKDKELEHQKVVSLMKDQELNTLNAIVEGQEKERARIAEDLHDNLGSKLALLKLHFDSYIDDAQVKNNKEILIKFEKTGKLLDDTYQTVRSMAHIENYSDVRQSLIYSVKSLAININSTGKTKIEVTNYGFTKSIDPNLEIFTFRIIQELITNIIKYAKANFVNIDLSLFDGELNVIVSDDGVGFDNTINRATKGMGLKTIEQRVLQKNGTFAIDTGLGNGTTVLFEIPLTQKQMLT